MQSDCLCVWNVCVGSCLTLFFLLSFVHIFYLFSSFLSFIPSLFSCNFTIETSVFTSCFFLSKSLCLFLRVPVCDSLTIILEEIPWVACQSQLTTNPSWVERGIFHINHGIWLWASQAEWTPINRLPLHVVTALSNTKADCSNHRLWYSREKGLVLFLCVAELVIRYYQAVKFSPWNIRSEPLNAWYGLNFPLSPSVDPPSSRGFDSTAENSLNEPLRCQGLAVLTHFGLQQNTYPQTMLCMALKVAYITWRE